MNLALITPGNRGTAVGRQWQLQRLHELNRDLQPLYARELIDRTRVANQDFIT